MARTAQRKPRTGKPRPGDASLPRLLLSDIKRTQFRRQYRQELWDLYVFYLDAADRERLASMGRVGRWVRVVPWLLKSLLTKLTPGRRLALAAALLLFLLNRGTMVLWQFQFEYNLRSWAFLVLLVVLALELKDKLVARDEIMAARQVQLAILPQRAPSFAGWSIWSRTIPANDVGGDLVDFFDLPGERLAAMLGDVSGKGLPAALLMAKLQATLRAMAPESTDLARLARRVNQVMCRDGIENRFATLFYAELAHDGTLRYFNAGHNPPLLVREGAVEKMHASGIPVGMLEGAEYAGAEATLAPGDLLIVYSDGLVEARDARGEEFGLERLERLAALLRDVPVEQAGATIAQRHREVVGDGKPTDDWSLLLVRYAPRS
ncbi:MAG: serine/threonine-protein phosphatase [Acidobacteria bacterium]|nr:serine/threonine-protein phosphatase [Acidobacteriota bacterium]